MPTKNPYAAYVYCTNDKKYDRDPIPQPRAIELTGFASDDFLKEVFGVVPTKKSKQEVPAIKRIVYHDPATIVFWQDGTKTVVKCMDGEPFEKYAGFCAALAKKVFGSTSKAKKVAGAKKKGGVEE